MATAFFGLLVATGATVFVSFCVDQLGAVSSARALRPLDHVAKVVMAVAAMGALNTAMAFIHVRVYNGRAAASSRRTMEAVSLILCASTGVLFHLIFFVQPVAGDGAHDLLPLAVVVVRALLPASAAATFFASVVLIYARLRAGLARGAASAGSMATTTSVKLLTMMIHAVALVTVVLSPIAAIIVLCYSE
ncbi:uncharacterized protein LOC102709091 [Oryza brachyantha]|uniref:uncharacterized protein LOC102709091 n=1 Tax=Oryza brachyantha TaxID=4533 RepID=UPI001ADCAF1C|nr:uncharacterized protein LOC102709091 [Oryza brachyantha]